MIDIKDKVFTECDSIAKDLEGFRAAIQGMSKEEVVLHLLSRPVGENTAYAIWVHADRLSYNIPQELLRKTVEARKLSPDEEPDTESEILVEFEGERYGVKTAFLYDGTGLAVSLCDARYIVPVGPWSHETPPKPEGGWKSA